MYVLCPVLLSMVGETSQGIWWGSSYLKQSPLFYFIFLVIYSEVQSLHFSVQLINCQLFDLLLSLRFKYHMLETNSQFTPELFICALGDLIMRKLACAAHWQEWKHPTLFGLYGNFLCLFIFRLGSRFVYVRLLPFTLCCIIITSFCVCM
jgi:hypothetical protein